MSVVVTATGSAWLLLASLALAPAPEGAVEGPAEAGSDEDAELHYDAEDVARLRERYALEDEPSLDTRKPKWRCLIADPGCGFGVELLATSAYAYRLRQGDISVSGDIFEWNSARVSYEMWVNFAAHTETIGQQKFTRFTLGPKVAVVGSDNEDLWGNFGIAGRYWFGRGAWSPAFEFSSALSFKLTGSQTGSIQPQRSPVGITADVGVNVGGWGAIIVGGQYDTPLAREDLPEKYRVSAAGSVFVGFRGNVLWGLPAVSAVTTHAVLLRRAEPQP